MLVTGGYGFIGTRLAMRLAQMGASVVSPSRGRCDLTKREDAEAMIWAERPDVVFHLAGKVAGIEENSTRPTKFMTENLLMGINIVEASLKYGVKRFVNLGSACSYPKHVEVPVLEEELHEGYPEETNGAYGIAKRTIVDLCETVRKSGRMDSISVISANCYGPGDTSHHVIPDLIAKFLCAARTEASEVVVWGSGEPTRDFLYVDDLVDGLTVAGAMYRGEGPVNLGSDTETSIKDLASVISRAVGYRGNIRFDTSKPDGQARRLLDIENAVRSFGFKPITRLEEGIEKTVRWIEKEQEKGCGTQKV